ncbi:MAG: DUF58 domain-containing protein [Lachnospiraceae bacterium]|nr:DUF58 domain-containing protein [Lachnospiraceae bacterium]
MKKILTWICYVFLLAILVVLYQFNNHPLSLLVLFAAILLPILSIVSFRYAYRKIRFSVEFHSSTLNRGEKTALVLCAENSSLIPISKAVFSYRILNDLNPNDIAHKVELSVGPSEHMRYEVPISLMNCGNYTATLSGVELFDILGFVSAVVPVNSVSEAIVLPNRMELPKMFEDYRGKSSDETLYERNEKGSDPSEIFEIRDYRDGDRPQQIHWKLSAKENSLMVKEFADTTGETFEILLCHDFRDAKQLDAYFDLMYSVGILLSEMGFVYSFCYLPNDASQFERITVQKKDQVQDCVVAMYYLDPKASARNTVLHRIGETEERQCLVLAAQPLPTQVQATVLYAKDDLAALYMI